MEPTNPRYDWRQLVSTEAVVGAKGTPIHHRVTDALSDLLVRRVWQPGDQIPVENEIAAHFGISALTANKSVSTLVRAGRLERIKGKGTFVTKPKPIGQARIAVVMHCDLERPEDDYYFEGLVRGMQSALGGLGLDCALSFLNNWEPEVLAAQRGQVNAVLMVAPPVERWPAIEWLHGQGMPVVVLGASWPTAQVPCFESDNVRGTHAAMRYLMALGHREIGCVYVSQKYASHRDRLRAYCDFLSAHHIEPRPDWMVEHRGGDPELGVPELRRWLLSPHRPTAVLVSNYHSAVVLMSATRELGIIVPTELSVVGYDDPFSAAYLEPPLTTVAQALGPMGARAISQLLMLLQGHEAHGELFPAELRVRGSCASPANSESASSIYPSDHSNSHIMMGAR